jgi:fructokinase
MPTTKRIVGLGEALFDLFPDETRLGGAPLNVAVHARQLGNHAAVVSRIGQDQLGDRMIMELRGREVDVSCLQSDPDHPTGTVIVDFDEHGEPTYDIIREVAWDYLQYDYDLEDLAQHCDAICFGSLAQRTGQTRNTIYRMLDAARRSVRLFDVNLRQDYFDRRTLERSMEYATAVKLNAEELTRLSGMFGLASDPADAGRQLIDRFKLKWLALTRGPAGTTVVTGSAEYGGDPVAAADGGDPVGAGDAVAAALLHGVTRRWDLQRTVNLANHLGAHVASQQGACPSLTDPLRKMADAG